MKDRVDERPRRNQRRNERKGNVGKDKPTKPNVGWNAKMPPLHWNGTINNNRTIAKCNSRTVLHLRHIRDDIFAYIASGTCYIFACSALSCLCVCVPWRLSHCKRMTNVERVKINNSISINVESDVLVRWHVCNNDRWNSYVINQQEKSKRKMA